MNNNTIYKILLIISIIITIICFKMFIFIVSHGVRTENAIGCFIFCISTPVLIWFRCYQFGLWDKLNEEENIKSNSDKNKNSSKTKNSNKPSNKEYDLNKVKNAIEKFIEKKDYEKVISYSTEAIKKYPECINLYLYRLIACSANSNNYFQKTNLIIADAKKIYELDPENEQVTMTLFGTVYGVMCVISAYEDAGPFLGEEFLTSYENWFNEFPTKVFAIFCSDVENEYIINACNKIIEKYPRKFYFPYATLALIDVKSNVETSFNHEYIKANIEKAFEIKSDAQFSKKVRYRCSVEYLMATTSVAFSGDDEIISADILPVIDTSLIKNIKEDYLLFKDNLNNSNSIEKFENFINIINKLSEHYAFAVIENHEIIFKLVNNNPIEHLDKRILIDYLQKYNDKCGKVSMLPKLEKFADISVALNPDNSNAYVAKAMSELLFGENKNAFKAINKALKLDRNNKIAINILVTAYMLNNDYQKAQEVLIKLISKSKNSDQIKSYKDTLTMLEQKLSQQKIIDISYNEDNGRELDI